MRPTYDFTDGTRGRYADRCRMRAITLVAIAQSIAMEIDVVSVVIDRASAKGQRWVAQVEATYGGQTHTVQGEGASAEGAQMRTLALAVKAALPKAVLLELLELEKENT